MRGGDATVLTASSYFSSDGLRKLGKTIIQFPLIFSIPICLFETGSCYVVKGSLELAIVLFQSHLYTHALMCHNAWPSRLIYKNLK